VTTSAYKNDVEIKPIPGYALCENEEHIGGGGGDKCLEIAGRAICRECLIDALDEDRLAKDFGGFDIKEDQHPALAYLIANPINLLPPTSCTACPFYVDPDCTLLHKRLDDTTPICEWPQWQDAIKQEVEQE